MTRHQGTESTRWAIHRVSVPLCNRSPPNRGGVLAKKEPEAVVVIMRGAITALALDGEQSARRVVPLRGPPEAGRADRAASARESPRDRG